MKKLRELLKLERLPLSFAESNQEHHSRKDFEIILIIDFTFLNLYVLNNKLSIFNKYIAKR